MNAQTYFRALIDSQKSNEPWGIASVCSAHPLVIKAAMVEAIAHDAPILIEATANQVNQHGGYTGMVPSDFRDFVYTIAEDCSISRERVLLGGDHLGPHPWRNEPADYAMTKASELVESYVLAGFSKIHLDTSMHLGGDNPDVPLDDEVIAKRSAALCAVAEQTAASRGLSGPVYVVGSEVPPPGGPTTTEEEENEIRPTSADAFLSAYRAYQNVFAQAGLQDAFMRTIAFVVQPGVEFAGDVVFDYNRENASALCAALKTVDSPIVFEGHSTDYQTIKALTEMVHDGIGILKVGPGLTFALREGLFALEAIERELLKGSEAPLSKFSKTLERVMLKDDKDWRNYYKGDEHSLYLQRRYSYYDRARYYMGKPEVQESVEILLKNLEKVNIREDMISQYLPLVYCKIRAGEIENTPEAILLAHVRHTLNVYHLASKPRPV
ncbi:MAG: class II D-tagatose-bisphosphate aldolase, non-catalytic subunit [Oscillospiraceae bacterium]|nr:class II D-tagatose-bisphosphate aldolase, non-catalytic subunit [Oscillospiraceae bacterium]